MTSGLVGEMHMLVLPSVPPIITVLLTILTWMVSVYMLGAMEVNVIFY